MNRTKAIKICDIIDADSLQDLDAELELIRTEYVIRETTKRIRPFIEQSQGTQNKVYYTAGKSFNQDGSLDLENLVSEVSIPAKFCIRGEVLSRAIQMLFQEIAAKGNTDVKIRISDKSPVLVPAASSTESVDSPAER